MPHIVETVVYAIEELSETAKESARTWYRDTCLDHEWYDAVFEDFETVCRLLGVTLRTSPVRLMGGGTRASAHVFFSGFWSQGDGACFEGTLSHAGARPGPSAPTRRRTRSSTASRTPCRRCNGGTSTSFSPTSATAATTATNTAWRSRSSATAPPGRR